MSFCVCVFVQDSLESEIEVQKLKKKSMAIHFENLKYAFNRLAA